jgi:hypothetical protein
MMILLGLEGACTVADPAVFERVNYMQVVTSYKPDPHWGRGTGHGAG